MRAIRNVFEVNLKIITWISAAFIGLSTVLSVINVFLRYGFGTGWIWADEFSIYIVIVMVFLYQCNLEYRDDQLSISVLAEMFSGRPIVLKVMYFFRMAVTFLLYGILIRSGFALIKQNLKFQAMTPVMHVPLWILSLVVTIGLMLVLVYWIVKFLPEGKKEGENIG